MKVVVEIMKCFYLICCCTKNKPNYYMPNYKKLSNRLSMTRKLLTVIIIIKLLIILFLFISQDAAQWYGIDWDGPIATCEQDEISVPEVFCPITPVSWYT